MKKHSLVTIPSTEERLVRSSTIDQEYVISVALPYHYHENSDRTYPVLYVLDSNWNFGLVVEMVRTMNTRVSFCNELPDAIIVGIGYPNGETLAEKHAQVCHRRLRDLTSMRDEALEEWHRTTVPINERIQSGGSSKFLEFIKYQIMPLIESEYHVDASNRTLLGHSLGGLFALNVAFMYPELFQKYVISSPAEIYENESWFKGTSINLSARMYLSTGEAELELEENGRTRFNQLAQLLRSRLTGGNALVEQIFPKLTHCAVVAPAYQAGLVAVLP